MELNTKSELLVNYIVAKYGLNTLGNFRLLASLPAYRNNTRFRKDMISFEKILSEQHGTFWTRKLVGNDVTITIQQPGGEQCFVDDTFGSVAGAILKRARETYPEYDRFANGPVVQAGHGVNVADIMRGFDHALFRSNICKPLSACDTTLERQYYTTAIDDYDEQAAFLKPVAEDATDPENFQDASDVPLDNPILPYQLFECIHNIFVLMRLDNDINEVDFGQRGKPLPFATQAELGGLMFGMVQKSIESAIPLPDITVEFLQKAYPKGELSKDRKQFLLLDEYDPFTFINSKKCDLRTSITRAPIGSKRKQITSVALEAAITSAVAKTPKTPLACDGATDDDVEEAIELINVYKKSEYPSQSKETKAIWHFGSRDGEVYFRTLSASKKNILRQMKDHKYTLRQWILGIVQIIGPPGKITRKQLALLAAGRTNACCDQVEMDLEGDPPTIEKK